MEFNAGRQPFFASALIGVLLTALFATRYLLAPYPAEAPFEGGMPLAAALVRFSAAWPILAAVVAGILLLWTLFIVIQLTVKYSLATDRNYIPLQIFLIAATGLVISGEALASLFAAWLMALSVRQFIFSFHKGYRFEEVFRAGLYLGVIPLLYAPSAVVVLLSVFVVPVIYRRSAREAVVCAAGVLLPVPVAGFIHWAAGSEAQFIYSELWRCAVEGSPVTTLAGVPLSVWVVAGLVTGLVLVAFAWSLSHKKGARRRQYTFMLHLAFVSAALAASTLLGGSSPTLMPVIAVPLALASAQAFSERRWAIASSIIYCLILAAVSTLELMPVLGFSLP